MDDSTHSVYLTRNFAGFHGKTHDGGVCVGDNTGNHHEVHAEKSRTNGNDTVYSNALPEGCVNLDTAWKWRIKCVRFIG